MPPQNTAKQIYTVMPRRVFKTNACRGFFCCAGRLTNGSGRGMLGIDFVKKPHGTGKPDTAGEELERSVFCANL